MVEEDIKKMFEEEDNLLNEIHKKMLERHKEIMADMEKERGEGINNQITAEEIIHTIESGFSGIITADAKHFCITDEFRNELFQERTISVKELLKLFDWEDKEISITEYESE